MSIVLDFSLDPGAAEFGPYRDPKIDPAVTEFLPDLQGQCHGKRGDETCVSKC